jgi:hypothetical protein
LHQAGAGKHGKGHGEHRKDAAGGLGQGKCSHRISPAVMDVKLI